MESEILDYPIYWKVNINEPPDLTQPEGWNKAGYISTIESILNTYIVVDRANDARTTIEQNLNLEMNARHSNKMQSNLK